MKHFIQTMAPGWFASVMGTSVASLAAWLLFAGTPWQIVADVLHYLAIVMMVVLGLAGLARILMFPRRVFETMSHPVEGSFYATFPIAMLVMAGQWSIRGIDPVCVGAMWWTGTAGRSLRATSSSFGSSRSTSSSSRWSRPRTSSRPWAWW